MKLFTTFRLADSEQRLWQGPSSRLGFCNIKSRKSRPRAGVSSAKSLLHSCKVSINCPSPAINGGDGTHRHYMEFEAICLRFLMFSWEKQSQFKHGRVCGIPIATRRLQAYRLPSLTWHTTFRPFTHCPNRFPIEYSMHSVVFKSAKHCFPLWYSM